MVFMQVNTLSQLINNDRVISKRSRNCFMTEAMANQQNVIISGLLAQRVSLQPFQAEYRWQAGGGMSAVVDAMGMFRRDIRDSDDVKIRGYQRALELQRR